MINIRKLTKKYAIFFLIGIFTAIYTMVAVIKHNHFQTGLDFGIYVQTFWSYIHLKLPRVTFYPTYGDVVWSDHFTPSLFLLSPIYYFFPDPKILLFLQSFLFTLGVYPIYLFARDKTKNWFFSIMLSFSYFLFFGTQFALTFDFHSATYSAVFLPWVLYFLFYQKWKWFFIFSALFIGAKEDAPIILSAIGAYLIVTRKNVKIGIVTGVISFIYLILVTKIVMPALSIGGAKTYTTPGLPFGFIEWISVLFDSEVKIKTIMLSFGSFIFLPLLSGWFLILPWVHFFTNFVSKDFMGRWDIYLHYRIHLAAIMSFASVLGYLRLKSMMNKKTAKKFYPVLLPIFLFFTVLFMDYKLHLPLNTVFKPHFYQTESWMMDNFEVMSKIPKDSYLLTQNNLAPHVANREFLYYFPKNIEKAEYIFLDLRSNQPIINFWLSGEEKDIRTEVNHLLDRGVFYKFYQKGGAFLLKRQGLKK